MVLSIRIREKGRKQMRFDARPDPNTMARSVDRGAAWTKRVRPQPAASSEDTMSSRQSRAMKDPFGYSVSSDIPDINGGGVGDFDQKAFGKDLDHVLNP